MGESEPWPLWRKPRSSPPYLGDSAGSQGKTSQWHNPSSDLGSHHVRSWDPGGLCARRRAWRSQRIQTCSESAELRQTTLAFASREAQTPTVDGRGDNVCTDSPEEGGSNSDDHRAPLMARVPAVVHISYYPAVRGHHGACSGGGNTQEEHHLAAQELSYTGAQDLAPISCSMEDRLDRSSQRKRYIFLIIQIVMLDNPHLNCVTVPLLIWHFSTTSALLNDLYSLHGGNKANNRSARTARTVW